MMYLVYAVKYTDKKEKQRFFLNALPTLEEAKHLANCATCGSADYAYVKNIPGETVFYLEKADPSILYEEGTLPRAQCRPPLQA